MVYNGTYDLTPFVYNANTPCVRDPDDDDEDNNTGYMKEVRTAYFISGNMFQNSCNYMFFK